MKFPTTVLLFALLVFIFCLPPAFSQNLKLKAEESPLNTVFYLLSTTEKDSKEDEKACLASSFVRANKFGELEKVAGMVEQESYVDEKFVSLINNLIVTGKTEEASKFLSFLINKFGNDEDDLQMVFKPLILLKRDAEALQILNKFDDSDKIDGALAIAETYLKLGQKAKALDVIESIKNLAEKSEYGEDKANVGLYYAKLGKETEALRFLQESMKNLEWKEGKPEYSEGRILDRVVEIYRALKKDKEADEILARQGITEEPKTQTEIAESYFAEGNPTKAREIFEKIFSQLEPKEDYYNLVAERLIEIYLKLGEIDKAESLAVKLAGSDHSQQKYLLEIADFYIKQKNKTKAVEILNFAFEQTVKIDTSEAESGSLWTSGKWNQARYQSQIALRFVDLQFDQKALELISQLKKPYLRALMLTEFVSVNKKRIPAQKLKVYLDEALALLKLEQTEIFDSKKFDVLAITARMFAEIGMAKKANDVFAETLSLLDEEMIENGTDSSLLYVMCNIGVEFENSKIAPNEKLRKALREIIKNWEDENY